jgi:hypothetical protein
MKPKTMTTLPLKKPMCRSPLRFAFLLIPLALTLFTFPQMAQAEDGSVGSAGSQNTAEGTGALQNLATNGVRNTAVGFDALLSNTGGGANTAIGAATLARNTANNNTACGSYALNANTTGDGNTATGIDALMLNIDGSSNTANGASVLFNNTRGGDNTANGSQALFNNTTGNNNTVSGFQALSNNTGGSFNIALGSRAGANLTTGSNNIDIGHQGVSGESKTIRIGNKLGHTSAYIAGIYGKTVASGVGVIIGSAGLLGTVQSSARFKEAIKPMDKASEALLALKPVTFRYKHELDPDGIPQFGLIAEEVERVNPDLVVRDEDGKVNTVRFEAVNAMLLNEFLKEHRKVEEQGRKLQTQETAIAKQQKQIEALTATVRKVSDQIALTRPAPQLVANP